MPTPTPTPTRNLFLSTRTRGEETILTGVGRIDLLTTSQLRETLTELIDIGHHRLILDLTQVASCNSTGLAAMIYALRKIIRRNADGHMFLVCDGPVLRALQLSRATRIFEPPWF